MEEMRKHQLEKRGSTVAPILIMQEHPRRPDVPRPAGSPDIIDLPPGEMNPAPPPDIPPQPMPERPDPQRDMPGPK
jgi:hypothetical protein